MTPGTRNRWFGVVAGLVVLVVVGPALIGGYQALCTAPVDTYPILAASRTEAVTRAGSGWSVASITARVQAEALDALLVVKQSDPVAFPSHAAAGLALEQGKCAPQAIRDQWRKAAAHASSDWSAHFAAGRLADATQTTPERLELLAQLSLYAEQEPWHAANLARVEAALQEATTVVAH